MDDHNDHNAAVALVLDAVLSVHDRISIAIDHLPVLSPDHIPLDDACPICLFPFRSILSQSTTITKVPGCGHIFCRKDLCEWIRSQHGTCPTCRHSFLNIRPPSDSDDESSDGGEYIPPADMDEDEEDAFLDADAFTEENTSDFNVDEMGLEVDDFWGSAFTDDEDAGYERDGEMDQDDLEDHEYGLTDGESMSSSDADLSLEGDRLDSEGIVDDNVSVHLEDDRLYSDDRLDHYVPPEEDK